MIKVYIIYVGGNYPYKLQHNNNLIIKTDKKDLAEECRIIYYNNYYDSLSQTTQQRYPKV